MRRARLWLACCAALLFIGSAPGWVFAAEKFITIGTGGVTGIYYPAGGGICRLIMRMRGTPANRSIDRCFVESTGGSIDNISEVLTGKLDFGTAQSDWQYHAAKGDLKLTGPAGDPLDASQLRSVFSLYSEPFTVVVRRDSGITTFDDIKGRRINLGEHGAGTRATMEEIMATKGWSIKTFSKVSELKMADQGKALCDKQVDVILYASGHPNGAINEVAMRCPIRILSVEGPAIKRLVAQNPSYAFAAIPGGMYPGVREEVHTFGPVATLVTSASTDPAYVYTVTKAVFDNLDEYKSFHPVFSLLDPHAMVTTGNSAPLHEGALRYYREVGLLPAK